MLAGADQERPEYLQSVYIDHVFVVASASNGVLRAELIAGRDAGKGDDQALNAASGGVGEEPDAVCVDALHRAGLLANGGDRHFSQLQGGVVHLHIESYVGIRRGDDAFGLVEPQAGVDDGQRITWRHGEAVISLLVRHRSDQGVFHPDVHQLQRAAVGVSHIARNFDVAFGKGHCCYTYK